jgi:RNA polymerase sigma-70 factor (ECF subfamily)
MGKWFSGNIGKKHHPDQGKFPCSNPGDPDSNSGTFMSSATSPEPDDPPAPGAGDVAEIDVDAELMHQTAAGSETSFAMLVGRHQKSLLNFFVRMGAYSDGEDLVQETFVRLYRYREKYQSSARFSAFLYHIARNVWADHGRKSMRTERIASSLRDFNLESGENTSQPPQESLDIEAALDKLSPKLREVIVLNIYQGLRYQEVADALGIPLGTVKSRINLALHALKEILHEK